MIGLYFEELEIGWSVDLGDYHFTEENMMRYKNQFAPVPFHLNAEDAAQGLFGRTAAAGFHICSAWMACFVATNQRERLARAARGETLPEVGPSPGLENVTWPLPVFSGETVVFCSEVFAKRDIRSRAGWGLLTLTGQGKKDSGQKVLEFRTHILVAKS